MKDSLLDLLCTAQSKLTTTHLHVQTYIPFIHRDKSVLLLFVFRSKHRMQSLRDLYIPEDIQHNILEEAFVFRAAKN